MCLHPPQHLYWAFLILAILVYGNLCALWFDLLSLNSNATEHFYVFMGYLHNFFGEMSFPLPILKLGYLFFFFF